MLSGELPDQCALQGVITHLDRLGVEIIEIRQLPPSLTTSTARELGAGGMSDDSSPRPPATPRSRGCAQQVQDLQRQLDERPASLDATTPIAVPARPGRLSGWWRPPVVVVLLIIATVCAPAAVVARWTSHQLGDTDTYVQTVAPLASEPSVQAAITDQVTNAIFTRLDVQAITGQAVQALEAQGLPPNIATALTALSGPLSNGVESFVHDQVAKIVASQQFQDAWTAANRAAHAQLVAVLTGDQSGAVTRAGQQRLGEPRRR